MFNKRGGKKEKNVKYRGLRGWRVKPKVGGNEISQKIV